MFQEQESYIVLHRFTQDPSSFLTKSPMLEVIILIRDEKLKYDHPVFAQKINDLEKEYLTTRKVRFQNYSIIESCKKNICSIVLKLLNICWIRTCSRHTEKPCTASNIKTQKLVLIL